ncbi:hypothetical protein PFTANZ_05834, partial [Plasmodium falciparum Tanzania (2000708)]
MFYTLGDYRDILVRGGDVNSGSKKEGDSSSNEKNLVVLASGSDKKSRDEMEAIQKKIQEHINNGSKPVNSSPATGGKNPGQTPKDWWDKIAEPIWNGMICALTYKDGEEGKPPKEDDSLKGALLEGGKPKKEDYKYDQVKLEENSVNDGPKPTPQTAAASSDTPLLSDFVLRPPYFRYLEEWGETFCREKKKRLENIKVECNVEESGPRGNEKNPKCSCYGENCKDQLEDNPSTDADLKCPG